MLAVTFLIGVFGFGFPGVQSSAEIQVAKKQKSVPQLTVNNEKKTEKTTRDEYDYLGLASKELNIKVLEPKGTMRGVEATQLVEASFKDMLLTLTDYDKFDQYMPNVDRSKTVKEEKGQKWVDTELDFGLFGVEYVLKMDASIDLASKKAKISWVKDSGEMKQIKGSWWIQEKDSFVAVKYESFLDPGLSIPGWIQDRLTKGAVPDLFEAIAERSKKNSLSRKSGSEHKK